MRPRVSRRWLISTFAVVAMLGTLGGCVQTPTLTDVLPGTGYPRQLLAVDGTSLFATVVWNAGTPNEVEIYNGWLGTRYFQVPDTASPGVHTIALRNSEGTSAPVNVTVLAPSGVFPAPRIDDIGVWSINGAGPVDVVFTVAGANIDTDAIVTVNGGPVAETVGWGGLPVDYLQAHTPSTFGYPIYHYNQLLSVVENVALGSALTVLVTNNDGLTATETFTLPTTIAALDGDGDGLLDTWEENGYTAPSGVTIDIGAMGASRWRKDILVEVDWIAAATPNPTIWATIEAAFEDAPVLNPDGSAGIDIIIDRGQGAPFTNGGDVLADHQTMDFGANPAAGYTDFFTYKGASFDNDRLNIFHYSVFGRVRPNGSSGRGEVWGNDFMVTFATFAVWPQDVAQVGTFIHELGHNLGLSHGDLLTTPSQWNNARKPNFPTTMSFRYQFPGVSVDCDFTSEGAHTFSQGMFARIVETGVNENIGICDNSPLDMNADGAITSAQMDVSADGDSTDTHDDFNQWNTLLLDFDAVGSNWNGN